jgi:hypothetical protein
MKAGLLDLLEEEQREVDPAFFAHRKEDVLHHSSICLWWKNG